MISLFYILLIVYIDILNYIKKYYYIELYKCWLISKDYI